MSLRFLQFFHSLLEIGLSFPLPLTASWDSVGQIRFRELTLLVALSDRLGLYLIAKLYTFGHHMRSRIKSKRPYTTAKDSYEIAIFHRRRLSELSGGYQQLSDSYLR